MRQLVLPLTCLGLVLGACTLNTDLPAPPGPGSIQGTLTYSLPGRTDSLPAAGATVELLGTSLTTKATDTGYFQLGPVPFATGQVSIRFDADGDGLPERSKLLSLEAIRAGPGKTVALGTVHLGGNATLQGSVLRSDILGSTSGHGGTNVFVPQGPYLVFTGDNGGFTLPSLPEGDITIAVFRDGYQSQQFTLSLRPLETATLPTVILTPNAGVTPLATVTGVTTLSGESTSAGVTITVAGRVTRTAQSQNNGQYSIESLPQGLYTIAFERQGFQTVVLRNIVVAMPNVQAPTVVLFPGMSTPPDLDAGVRFDAGTPVPDAGVDAGQDAGLDAGQDAGLDAGQDAGLDAGQDAGLDAGQDAGLDAGQDAGLDAGPDAGLDAGPDAGLDAGPDAGLDAGQDAGPDAGQDAGPDAGLDGGLDAGAPPTAIINPLPPFIAPGASVMLNGQNSIGTRPFIYRWTAPVTVPNNNTSAAATPTITAPASPTVLNLGLEVVDAVGRVSAPATTRLSVGTQPSAIITPGTPTSAFALQTVVFDGTPSSDPGGTGISQYTWSVSPAGFQTSTTNNGARLLITMPAVVSVAQVVQVTLSVVNGVDIRSNTVSRSFTLVLGSPPTWSIDAGQGQTVNSNAIVTLVGSAAAPGFPPDIFSYEWSPSGSLDGGPGADWLLTNPDASVTTFVAPAVVGINRLIPFVLTVTNDAGLTPLSQQAITFVSVRDTIPPSIVRSDYSVLRMGNLGFTIDFSEPVDPGSLNTITANPANETRRVLSPDGRRVTIVLGAPVLADGTPATVQLTSVRDRSPQSNALPVTTTSVIARLLWSPPIVSDGGSPTDPKPGLVMRESKDGGLEVFLFGRRNDKAWFLAPFNPYDCSAPPCEVPDDPTAPGQNFTAFPPRGVRGALWKDVPLATLQQRDSRSPVGFTFAYLDGGWQPFPAAPGTVFTDGENLFSAYPENGLRVASFDTKLGGWNVSDAGVLTSDAVLFAFDGGLIFDPLPIGAARLGNDSFVASKTSANGELRAFGQTGANGSWVGYGALGTTATPDKVVETRTALTSLYTNSAYTSFLRQSGRVDVVIYGSVGNGSTVWASGVTGFDTNYRENHWWGVGAVAGQLRARTIPFGTGATTIPFPGPQPGDSLNANVSCTADSPELAYYREKVGIVWAEKCGAEPWRIVFRLLN